jgi:excinuclease UvrABC ATPase subunit
LGSNSRSTVGTVTELYGLLRLLYAKVGEPQIGDSNLFSFNKPEGMCEVCKGVGLELVVDEDQIVDWTKSLNKGAIIHPDYKVGGWFWRSIASSKLFDMNLPLEKMSEEKIQLLLHSERRNIDPNSKKKGGFGHNSTFEGVIAAIKRRRLMRESTGKIPGASEAVEQQDEDSKNKSKHRDIQFFEFVKCSSCNGARLNPRALSVLVRRKNISELCDLELTELDEFLGSMELTSITEPIISRLRERLEVLIHIGVGYLSFSRAVGTLSGGECQRVKMARQLGCDLVGMIYVLDGKIYHCYRPCLSFDRADRWPSSS